MLVALATALALLLSPSAPSAAQPRPATLIAFGDAADCKVRGVVHLIMASPLYQLS